jgi:hypothetical protein
VRIVETDANRGQTFGLVCTIDGVERRHLYSARCAPRCPEIDNHDLPRKSV